MESTSPSPPKRRWYRRRGLHFALALLLGCVGAYFIWDALFMPDDLRRMQGSWKIVRVLDNDKVMEQDFVRVVIAGRRITAHDQTGARDDSYPLDIVPERQELLIFEEEEMTVFGTTFKVPSWLKRGQPAQVVQYTLSEPKLELRVQRGGDDRHALELVREGK